MNGGLHLSGKTKKTNTGKTINFAEKKKALSSKKAQSGTNKSAYNDNRVIQYDINKMREQINQQTKNKNKTGRFASLNYPIWVKAVYIAGIVILAILIVGKFTNNFGTAKPDKIPEKFAVESSAVAQEDFLRYDRTIKTYLSTYVKSDGDISIVTTSMHKNDNIVYANGYFKYPGEKGRIPFDAVIKSDKVDSVVVNGYELTHKRRQ